MPIVLLAPLLTRPLGSLGIAATRAAAALLALVGIWTMVLIDFGNDRAILHEQSLSRVQGYAIGFAETLQKSILQIDQLSMTLVHLHESGAPPAMLTGAYRGVLDELPLYPIFLDENGIGRYTRTPPKTVLDLSGRDFFEFHRTSPSRALRINPREEGIGVFAGQTIVRLSRRVNKRDGSFGGVVAITMLPRFMNAFNDESALEVNDFASVWLGDGPMLTNRTEGWGTQIFQHYKTRPDLPGNSGSRLEPGELFHDNGAHYIGWKRLRDYPVIALVGLTEANVQATLSASRAVHFGGAILGSLFVLLLAWSNARSTLRRQAAQEKIARTEARYRHAVDSVREAVFVFTAAGNDFEAEDCNAQAIHLVDRPRELVLGKALDKLFVHDDALRLREMLRATLLSGSEHQELKLAHRGMPAWFFIRAVRIDHSIALTLRDITELKTREQQVQAMAMSDPLTLLHNRMWLDAYLPEAISLARAESRRLGLIMLDLDDFKLVNDTLGHKIGDEVLVTTAVALKRSLRQADHVVRIGGDSFALLIEQMSEPGDLNAIVTQLRAGLDAVPWPGDASGMRHKVSIGLACYPDDGKDAVALLKAAEVAVHAASSTGGVTRRYEPNLLEAREQRRWLEGALPQAAQRGELRLYLQPRVSAATGRLLSFEALVRWQHPQRGLIMPSEFIPVAEDTGAIVEIGAWVLRAACARLAAWRAEQRRLVPISVNVSAVQLRSADFRLLFSECLVRHDLAASLLPIELTESTMVGDDPMILAVLARLHAMGVQLHIDDFGTGYSSLAQLQRVAVDALKVDQSFVRALGVRGQGRQLCEAVIGIGKSLGATVVAEGVETVNQFRQLRAMGCDEIQGFLISPPVPEDMAGAMLDAPALGSLLEIEAEARQ